MLVVNTCAFIDSAKQESIDTILEMAQHKKDGACRRLVVTGCLAERYRDELRAEIPGDRRRARHRRSPGDRRARSADVGRRRPGSGPRCTFYPVRRTVSTAAAQSRHRRHREPVRPTSTTPTRRACWRRRGTTPTSRSPKAATTSARSASSRRCAGHYRSRPADSIVREARALAARGVKELLLISQDTTFYGIDRGERGALARLLRELNARRRPRVDPAALSLSDDDRRRRRSRRWPSASKVCKYIDLPLQHASNPVLKRMKRPGTRQGYDALLDRIRARVPGVALRTTFIVGFPGETEADVDELCEFVRRSRLRPCRRLHLLARGRHVGLRARRTTCRRGSKTARRQPRDEPAEAAACSARQRQRGSASGRGCWSTARRRTTSSS